MELQKLFHSADAFFIAERLDAIQNALPIPPHELKEFHNEDAFYIWSHISGGGGGGGSDYAGYTLTFMQDIAVGVAVSFNSASVQNNISLFGAGNMQVVNAGVFKISGMLTLGVHPAQPPLDAVFALFRNGVEIVNTRFITKNPTGVVDEDFVRQLYFGVELTINPADIITLVHVGSGIQRLELANGANVGSINWIKID